MLVKLTPLSERAKAVCETHWFGTDDPRTCRDCPIRRACHAACGPGAEALNTHTRGVNAAAEKA